MQRLEVKAAFSVDEEGRIEGKAWDFSKPDRVGDIIEPIAFTKAVGQTLPMLFAHDQAQVIGAWNTIGVEPDGLKVIGKMLTNDVARAREVRAMVKANAVTGISIGFITKKAAPRTGGGRTISDIDLVEVSLVAAPSHPDARVTNIKSVQDERNNMSTENTALDVKAIETVVAQETKALSDRLIALETKANRLEAANDNNETGELEAKALNTWLKTGQTDPEIKTLVVGTPAAGGYTVAPEYSTNVIKKVTEINPMRQLASVMTIGTNEVYIPTLETDPNSGWVTETGPRPESEPTFGQVNIKVFEHAVIIPVSRQLLEDSFIDLQSFLADRISVKFAEAEANAFLTGDGNGKPTGVAADVNVFEGVTAGADILEDIVDTFYALKTVYANRGAWLMSRKTMGAIRKAADVSSTRGSIWSDGIGNGTPARLLGAPVYEAALDDYGATSTIGASALFGDFASAYQIVDRVGLDILRDDYTGADNGIVKFRARRRVGGKLVLAEPVVALKAA